MEAAMDMDTRTVFTKLGGWTPLNMAVSSFYDKLLADPLLAPFFEGISMEKLRKKQMSFMAFAFGGATTYFGKTVVHAHRKMIKEQGLGLVHFDAVVGHFKETLAELGLPQTVVDEATSVLMTTRPMFDAQALSQQDSSASAQDKQLQQRLLQLQKSAGSPAGSEGGCPSNNGNSKPASKATAQLADRLRISTLADILGPMLSSRKAKGSDSKGTSKSFTKSVPGSAGISENGAATGSADNVNASIHTSGQDSISTTQVQDVKLINGNETDSACGKNSNASSNVLDDAEAAKEAKRERRRMLKQMIKDLDNLPTAASSGNGSAGRTVFQVQNASSAVAFSNDVNASNGESGAANGQHKSTATTESEFGVKLAVHVKPKPTFNSAPTCAQTGTIATLPVMAHESSPNLAIKHNSQNSASNGSTGEGTSSTWASPSAMMGVYHNTFGLQLETNQSDGSGDSSGVMMPADSDDELQQHLSGNRQTNILLRTGSTGRSSRFSKTSFSKEPGSYVDDEYVAWHPSGVPSVAAVQFANLSTLSEVSETERDSSLGALIAVVRNSTTSPS